MPEWFGVDHIATPTTRGTLTQVNEEDQRPAVTSNAGQHLLYQLQNQTHSGFGLTTKTTPTRQFSITQEMDNNTTIQGTKLSQFRSSAFISVATLVSERVERVNSAFISAFVSEWFGADHKDNTHTSKYYDTG